ncbi:MAG: HAD-IIB family hydrolase [Propionibacteriaceae bacterium]
MTPVRLIATDLDGTLLTNHVSISDTNIAALKAAKEAKLPVVVATGRPPYWVQFLREYAELLPTAVVSNGAAILDMKTWEITDEFPLSNEATLDLVSELRRLHSNVVFAVDTRWSMALEDSCPSPLAGENPPRVSRIEPVIETEVIHKLIVKLPDIDVLDFYKEVSDLIGNRATATFSWTTQPATLEISAPSISKAHALEIVSNRLGVTSDCVAAFGDMPNDIEMLTWAGHPHAMRGAHPSLLKAGIPLLDIYQPDAVGNEITRLLSQQQQAQI